MQHFSKLNGTFIRRLLMLQTISSTFLLGHLDLKRTGFIFRKQCDRVRIYKRQNALIIE